MAGNGKRLGQKVSREVGRLLPAIKHIHHEIHTHPEVSLNEHYARDVLTGFLKQQGFRVESGLAGLPTSFRADAGGAAAGPRAAMLCEYDALPGIGHACGHSVIAAAGAAAGAVVHRLFPGLPITVMGTPGEETGSGKVALLKGGAFSGIDLAMMVHPSSKRQIVRLFLGVVGRGYVYTGKAAHAAAAPEQGINALDAAVLFYTGVSALRQQTLDQARIHVIITDGGKVPNIIPERAEVSCMIRALDLDVLADLVKKVDACARGAARSAGALLKILKSRELIMPLRVNRRLARVYEDSVLALGLEPFHGPEDRNIGSSDISSLSHAMPVIHPHVPISKPGEVSIHSREFEKRAGGPRGLEAAREGATILAMTAISVLSDPVGWGEISREFEGGAVKVPKGLA